MRIPFDSIHWMGSNSIDRKSTRLNSSHLVISYAVFCLKKKKTDLIPHQRQPPSYPREPPSQAFATVESCHQYTRQRFPPSTRYVAPAFHSLFEDLHHGY